MSQNISTIYEQPQLKILKVEDNNNTNQSVIIKQIIHKEDNVCNSICSNLQQEFQITQQANASGQTNYLINQFSHHQNTSFNNTNCCYIQMELAQQGSLLQFIQSNPQLQQDLLDLNVFKSMIIKMANALKFLHDQDIAHNDVKLDNFFVFAYDEAQKEIEIKIADLGYAYQGQRTLEEQKIALQYKNYYTMSPEQKEIQYKSQQINEKKSDIFSFGAMVFEIYTGFERKNLENPMYKKWINSDKVMNLYNALSKRMGFLTQFQKKSEILQIMQIIIKCLKYNPEERISIDQFISELSIQRT